MAKILLAWEFGRGLGHLAQLKPFVDRALSEGHQVALAAKELQNVPVFFSGDKLDIFQAPFFHRAPKRRYPKILSYSQLILQQLNSVADLELLFRAWNTIYDAVEPDVVVYESAPWAMAASHHRGWKKWLVGSGFFIPRLDLPFMGLFPGVEKTQDNFRSLKEAEMLVLTMINDVMSRQGLPVLDDVRDLFARVDHRLIQSLPETDHFGTRDNEDYVGISQTLPAVNVVWPVAGDCKVFAYLYNFPGVEKLLSALDRSGAASVVYSRELDESIKSRFPGIQFVEEPLDMGTVLSLADLMITMGGHTTAMQGMMMGIPLLLIPVFQEQFFFASRLVEQGRGIILPPKQENVDKIVAAALSMARAGRLAFDTQRRELYGGRRLQQRLDALFAAL